MGGKLLKQINMKKEFNFYVVIYNDSMGNQIQKPFFDDEGGKLTIVAIINVYYK